MRREYPEPSSESSFGFIGLGVNLGNLHAFPGRILLCLSAVGFSIEACSTWHVTKALGPDQPQYLNAVARLGATCNAVQALARLRQVEQAMGRQRVLHWGPRVVDLDLLVWGDTCITTPELTLPHPRLAERSFVLFPWDEIATDFQIPGVNLTVSELTSRLRTSS